MKRILHHPVVKKHGLKFMRFLVAGGTGFMVDTGMLMLLGRVYNWAPEYALIVSGGLSMLAVFLINKYFTFKDRTPGAHGKQAMKFFLVYLGTSIGNGVLSYIFIVIGFPDWFSKGLATGILLFVNFFFLQGFVFKKKELEPVGV